MFRCKQFTVRQEKCAMKVNTDSLILGSWVSTDRSSSFLDIGTGSGILALMLAQKSAPTATVEAVEIDENALQQARENVATSQWPNKITILQTDMASYTPLRCFDVIVSNPPYFDEVNGRSRGYQLQSTQRELARQTVSLTPRSLFSFARQYLCESGKLYCLYPFEREAEIITSASHEGLFATSRLRVQHDKVRAPYVTAFCFETNSNEAEIDSLEIRDGEGQYSPAFKHLCRDFYLNF